jgi:hypothetical protein
MFRAGLWRSWTFIPHESHMTIRASHFSCEWNEIITSSKWISWSGEVSTFEEASAEFWLGIEAFIAVFKIVGGDRSWRVSRKYTTCRVISL